MRIGTAVTMAAALGLGACQSLDEATVTPAYVPTVSTPVPLTAAQTEAVKTGIRFSLANPASATFSGPLVATADPAGKITVCGLVSAKRMPGGPGPKPFMGHFLGERFVTDELGGSDSDSQIARDACARKGITI